MDFCETVSVFSAASLLLQNDLGLLLTEQLQDHQGACMRFRAALQLRPNEVVCSSACKKESTEQKKRIELVYFFFNVMKRTCESSPFFGYIELICSALPLRQADYHNNIGIVLTNHLGQPDEGRQHCEVTVDSPWTCLTVQMRCLHRLHYGLASPITLVTLTSMQWLHPAWPCYLSFLWPSLHVLF